MLPMFRLIFSMDGVDIFRGSDLLQLLVRLRMVAHQRRRQSLHFLILTLRLPELPHLHFHLSARRHLLHESFGGYWAFVSMLFSGMLLVRLIAGGLVVLVRL